MEGVDGGCVVTSSGQTVTAPPVVPPVTAVAQHQLQSQAEFQHHQQVELSQSASCVKTT